MFGSHHPTFRYTTWARMTVIENLVTDSLGDESYRRSPNGSNERNTFCSTLLGVNREDDAWETQK